MRYSVMDPLVDMAAGGGAQTRKRPRHDEASPSMIQASSLPPLHAYHSFHQQKPAYTGLPPATFRPALPTLSQMLNHPSVHVPAMQYSAPPPPPPQQQASFQYGYAPAQQRPYIQQHQQQHQYQQPLQAAAAFQRSPHTSSPSPPPSEASIEDDEEAAEDKTPWPTASEYYELLTDATRTKSLPVYDLGVDPRGVPLQPEFIYNEPRSCMYFLKCSQLLGRGSFGFPRKTKSTVTTKNSNGDVECVRRGDATKEFEWRKMSFVTGLPKKQPVVRYITATCYSKTHRSSTEKKKVLRMHAVMLASDDGAGEQGDYVLVHIRAGGSKRVGVRTNAATTTPTAAVSASNSSPLRSTVTAAPSIHSLLSAHNQVMMMGDGRPVTPLVYNHNYGNTGNTGNSASPLVKRRRPTTDVLPTISGLHPRPMHQWRSPSAADHYHK